jgi:hypothetical protein
LVPHNFCSSSSSVWALASLYQTKNNNKRKLSQNVILKSRPPKCLNNIETKRDPIIKAIFPNSYAKQLHFLYTIKGKN